MPSLVAGGYSEAIREIEHLQSKRDVEFAVMAALIYYHKHSTVVDKEAVAELEANIVTAEARAPDGAKLTTAIFYWHIGSFNNAKKTAANLLVFDLVLLLDTISPKCRRRIRTMPKPKLFLGGCI